MMGEGVEGTESGVAKGGSPQSNAMEATSILLAPYSSHQRTKSWQHCSHCLTASTGSCCLCTRPWQEAQATPSETEWPLFVLKKRLRGSQGFAVA